MANKAEIRLIKLEDGHKNIMGKLHEMNDTLNGMDHVIRGNGRPGLVAKVEVIENKIEHLEVGKKDWKDFVAMGVSGGLVAVFTAVVQHFIR